MDTTKIIKEKRIMTVFTIIAMLIEISVLFKGVISLERSLFRS